MRALVTGGPGLVGSGIVAVLASHGVEVWPLARRSLSRIKCDLSTAGAALEIQQKVPRCDAIVHAAALLSGQAGELVAANVLGCLTVIELARAWDAWLTVISTVTIVDPAFSRHADENAPVLPRSAYHVSKLAAEQLVRLEVPDASQILRLPAPVGQRMPSSRFIPTLLRAAVCGDALRIDGRGTREQTYVDVRDVGQAVAKAIQARIPGTYNVAAAESHTNLEVARTILEVTGSCSPIVLGERPDPDDNAAWRVPIRKVQETFDWQPAQKLADSINLLAQELRGASE